MKLYQWLTVVLMAMFVCSNAMAQDEAAEAKADEAAEAKADEAPEAAEAAEAKADVKAEPKRYDGGSFTIMPPSDWLLVSGNLDAKDIAKLPESVKEHYNSRSTDVIFMDISSADDAAKGFKDSLNIVTINEPIAVSEDLVSELKNVLQQQYETMFEKFKLDTMEITKMGAYDVVSVKGSYTVLNYNIKMEQIMVPAKKESFVLTCTYDSDQEGAVDSIRSCREAMESLKLN